MAVITIRAAYASTATEAGARLIGFAEGDETEPYALFRQEAKGGPVWFEVNDELFGAEDAVTARLDPEGLTLTIDPARRPDFGFAEAVRILLRPQTEGADAALKSLRKMLGANFAD